MHSPYIPGCVAFHWSVADSPGAIHTWLFLPQHLSIANSSSARVGTWCRLPLTMMILFVYSFPGWDLNRSCVCCRNCCEFIRAVPCCVLKTLSPCSHPPPLALTPFPPSLPQSSLRFGRRAYDTDVTFRADYSEVC